MNKTAAIAALNNIQKCLKEQKRVLKNIKEILGRPGQLKNL